MDDIRPGNICCIGMGGMKWVERWPAGCTSISLSWGNTGNPGKCSSYGKIKIFCLGDKMFSLKYLTICLVLAGSFTGFLKAQVPVKLPGNV